ncbi:N-acetyltransferase [Ruminococcaceae bacterium OttesenSCG-928-A16]|nr:N-acetyltransferase [Ruminococcaceae bacterium OttesenSCG-928-A16]
MMDNLELEIRPETPTEYDEIRQMVKEVFSTAKRSDGDEHEFVDKLRARGGYIPALALVARQNGRLVGHIMLTQIEVNTASGEKWPALMLAPLSVVQIQQNNGIGTKLTEESLHLAKKMGYKAVFLAGHANYYPRFGFVPSWHYGIEYANPIPRAQRDNIMALELQPGVLQGVNGTIMLE